MIVKRNTVISTREGKHSEIKKYDEEKGKHDNLSLILSLSINELERMYTKEEENYLSTLLTLFDERWNSLSLDYQAMQQTMNYWQNGIFQNISPSVENNENLFCSTRTSRLYTLRNNLVHELIISRLLRAKLSRN